MLKRLSIPSDLDESDILGSLQKLAGSVQLDVAADYFEQRASRSQQTPAHKAMLNLMARFRRPRLALEIGTFFAGTAEVIADALWANGQGMIETIDADPVSLERAPKMIGEWPLPLRAFVRFDNLSSGNYLWRFLDRSVAGEEIDFAFIDGNHDYEFVYLDIFGLARFAAPNAFLILDNIILDGVYCAAREFLRANPSWNLFWYCWNEGAMETETGRTLIPRQDGHFVLIAPDGYAVGWLPRTFKKGGFTERHLQGVLLKFATPPKGVIQYSVILSSYPFNFHEIGTGSQNRLATGSFEMSDNETDFLLQTDLAITLPVEGSYRELELTLKLSDEADFGVLAEKPSFLLSYK